MHGHGARGQDADLLIPDLPPVAVRTVQHVAPPTLPDPRNVRQLVDEARSHEQSASVDRASIVESYGKTAFDALD
jgi:hypothetical protein